MPSERQTGGGGSQHGREYGRNRSGGSSFGGSSHGSYRGRSGAGRQNREPSEMSEGVIITLLENFGFINCADRLEDVFFHYSEMMQNDIAPSPEDLQVGQVVHFGLRGSYGENGTKKEKAVRVEVMPEGSEVQWDIEVDKSFSTGTDQGRKGNVQKPAPSSLARRDNPKSSSGGDWSTSCGIIQLVPEDVVKGGGGTNGGEDTVYFKAEDYKGSGKLGEKDLVQFQLVRNRKTKSLFARDIQLLQSEKERLALERETRLLETATKEEGVVLMVQNNGGFLRSRRHDLPIFFHNSHVETSEEGDKAKLEKGDTVEFLVVYDDMGATKDETTEGLQKVKLSARQVKGVTPGEEGATGTSFITKVAQDVHGTIVSPPTFDLNASLKTSDLRDVDLRGSYGTPGIVRLHEPVECEVTREDGTVEKVKVLEVELYPEDCPGGSRPSFHTEVNVALQAKYSTWIAVGDVVCFDIVQESFDYKTKSIGRNEVATLEEGRWHRFRANPASKDQGQVNTVTWTQLNPFGRFEGVVSTVKADSGFGFIKMLDRSVDVYFRLNAVFPENLNVAGNSQRKLLIGCLVSFDLRVAEGAPQQQQQNHHEHLRAGRILVLAPPAKPNNKIPGMKNSNASSTYFHCPKIHVCLRKGVYAKVTKRHANGSGMLEILYESKSNDVGDDDMAKKSLPGEQEKILSKASSSDLAKDEGGNTHVVKEKIVGMTTAERYEDFAKALDQFCSFQFPLDEIVFPDQLPKSETAIFLHMAESRKEILADFVDDEGKICDDAEVGATNWGTGRLRIRHNTEVDETDDITVAKKPTRKVKPVKPIVAVRFDASAMASPTKKEDPPYVPREDDVVLCDIYQSRPNGQFEAMNLHLVTRSQDVDVSSSAELLGLEPEEEVGTVSEVVNARQFGFIAAMEISSDGNRASVKEKVFFHFSDVVGGKGAKLRKGDEVKFKISAVTTNNKEKRTATNVIRLRPGTLPKFPVQLLKDDTAATAAAGACQGFILMEPSHTSLANTPSHKATHHPTKNGGASAPTTPSRWQRVTQEEQNTHHTESTIMEDGCILLLSDPKGLFSPSSKKEAAREEGETGLDEMPSAQVKDAANENGEAVQEKEKQVEGVDQIQVLKHLFYNKANIISTNENNTQSSRFKQVDLSNGPRRGDLVSFTKSSKGGVKEVKVLQRNAATLIRGKLKDINMDLNKAFFVVDPSEERRLKGLRETQGEIDLTEIVSCKPKLLRDGEPVEGILHDNMIYGVSRTKDLYVASKITTPENGPKKERPRLNLTVKKELRDMGGKIIAQSGMAKGPDSTRGFNTGWTSRGTWFAEEEWQSKAFNPTLLEHSNTDS